MIILLRTDQNSFNSYIFFSEMSRNFLKIGSITKNRPEFDPIPHKMKTPFKILIDNQLTNRFTLKISCTALSSPTRLMAHKEKHQNL